MPALDPTAVSIFCEYCGGYVELDADTRADEDGMLTVVNPDAYDFHVWFIHPHELKDLRARQRRQVRDRLRKLRLLEEDQ